MGHSQYGLTACAALTLSVGSAFAACQEDRVSLRGDWGEAQFAVELADDPEERARGLMFRESMPRGEGMLFVYDNPRRAMFWMKNTYIPLDMIFVDPTGRVARVHHDAVPHDETPIDGGPGVLYILEINGGLAAQYGIDEGSEIRHPAISADLAVWPCAG